MSASIPPSLEPLEPRLLLDGWLETVRVNAVDGAAGDGLGACADVSGEYAIVGAPGDDLAVSNAGSAYIFHREGNAWVQQAKLVSPNPGSNDYFGVSVAIRDDVAVVGVGRGDNATGLVYSFHREGTQWVVEGKLDTGEALPGSAGFGATLDMSGDLLVVGAPEDNAGGYGSCGAAYLYRRVAGAWVLEQKVWAADHFQTSDGFGTSVSVDGDWVAVGAVNSNAWTTDAGAVYFFHPEGGRWTMTSNVTPWDMTVGRFGWRVSLSGDYAFVVPGRNGNFEIEAGTVYVYRREGTDWAERQRIVYPHPHEGDYFGWSLAASGGRVLIGDKGDRASGAQTGAVYCYRLVGETWTLTQELRASDAAWGDAFGSTLALDGRCAVVGGSGDDPVGADSGSAYFFTDCDWAIADANEDARVNGADLALWQQHYDPLGLNAGNCAGWGDWDHNGRIDGGDLALWQQRYDPLGTRAARPLAPGQPDLFAADDSGVSDADNVTCVTTPRMRILCSVPGAAVRVYRLGQYLGDAVPVGNGAYEYQFTAGQLVEGVNPIAAHAWDGISESVCSDSLKIVLDTIAPLAPAREAAVYTVGAAWDVEVVGELAYVAAYDRGLQILDVSDPGAPALIGYCDTPGEARGLAVVGTYAYVADATGGLQIIDISTTSAPVIIGASHTSGFAYGVQVVGSLAYVADSDHGLAIFDVSVPSAPRYVEDYYTQGNVVNVQVVGSLAYLADAANGLLIVDVSNPSEPTPVGSYSAPGSVLGVDVSGSFAYLAVEYAGLRILDISVPSAPVLVSTFRPPAQARDVRVIGTLAYVAAGDQGLQIISVASPSFPSLVESYGSPARAWRLDVFGNHVYLASRQEGLGLEIVRLGAPVLDLGDASDTGPSDDDNVTGDLTPEFDVAVGAPYVRVMRDDVQVSGDYETLPVTLAAQSLGSHVYRAIAVDAAGNASAPGGATTVLFAVLPEAPSAPDLVEADDSGVSNVDNLTRVTTPRVRIDSTALGATVRIYRAGVYLGDATLVSGTTYEYQFDDGQLDEGANSITARAWDGVSESDDSSALLLSLDTVAPFDLYTEGSIDTPGHAEGLDVVGPLAYVADEGHGLSIFDVSVPSAPVPVGAYDTPGIALNVVVLGSLAYVADRESGLLMIDVSTPSAPDLVGTYNTPGDASDVQLVGSLAYVADGSKGLCIVSVLSPSTPTFVGSYDTPGFARAVQVVGSLAYVADDVNGLVILDISSPFAPVLVGAYDTPGVANDVEVADGLVYVTDSASGLLILDVRVPAAPVLVGSCDTPGHTYSLDLSGGLAFVTGWAIGVQVIDVHIPSAPVWVSSFDTAGNAYGVRSVGSMLWAVDGQNGLLGLRIGAPVLDLLASSDTGNDSTDNITDDVTPTFAIGGGAVSARIYRDGVQITADEEPPPVTVGTQPYGWPVYTARGIDAAGNVSDLTAPLAVRITVFPPTPVSVDLVDTDDSGVSNADNVTNVATPLVRIEMAAPCAAAHVYRNAVYLGDATLVSGTTWEYRFDPGQLPEGTATVFVRAFDGELESLNSPVLTVTLDTTAPSLPFSAGYYYTAGAACDVQMVGTLAYVAASNQGLCILDVSDPTDPVLVGSYNTPGSAYDVDVVGTRAYVADYTSGLLILDVSAPDAPALLGAYNTPGSAYGVHVSGNYAYVADYSPGLLIVDVSNPSAPVLAGSYNTPGAALSVKVVGTLAYVADGTSGLRIIDVSTPSAPTLRGYYDTPASANGVQVVGTLAYVADGASGLRIIDVSTPAAPTLEGYYDTPGTALDVQVVGALAYVADSASGLLIIDVSTPAAPTLAGSYDTPGYASGVFVTDAFAWVADSYAGLRVLYLKQPAPDLIAASDTGPSDVDNVTDDLTPTFAIPASGPFVRIYRDGALVSGEYETSPVTLDVQPLGTYEFTVRSIDAAGNLGEESEALIVTFVDPFQETLDLLGN